MKLRPILFPGLLASTLWLTGCKPDILAPPPDTVFTGDDGPVEVTFEIFHGSGEKLEFQFTHRELDLLDQADSEPKLLFPEPVRTVHKGQRRTEVTWAFDQAGSWRARTRNRETAGPWSSWTPFVVVDDDQPTVAASLSLDTVRYEGPCPTTITGRAVIATAAPGPIRYWFRSSSGEQSQVKEDRLAAPTTLLAHTGIAAVGNQPGVPDSGWLEAVVESLPTGAIFVSERAPFEIACTNTPPPQSADLN